MRARTVAACLCVCASATTRAGAGGGARGGRDGTGGYELYTKRAAAPAWRRRPRPRRRRRRRILITRRVFGARAPEFAVCDVTRGGAVAVRALVSRRVVESSRIAVSLAAASRPRRNADTRRRGEFLRTDDDDDPRGPVVELTSYNLQRRRRRRVVAVFSVPVQ